jgi:hypothetical protein
VITYSTIRRDYCGQHYVSCNFKHYDVVSTKLEFLLRPDARDILLFLFVRSLTGYRLLIAKQHLPCCPSSLILTKQQYPWMVINCCSVDNIVAMAAQGPFTDRIDL